ncbi:4Fe-4S ferredoxin, partial [Candidatus Bathyarchaeota archaeon]
MGEGFLEGIIDNFTALTKLIGKERMGYINFITEVTPHCDCPPYSDAPIVPDIGIVASKDPIAIDKCSADLINAAAGLKNSILGDADKEEALMPGFDKISHITGRDWTRLLKLGERVGLGSLEYDLIKIDV